VILDALIDSYGSYLQARSKSSWTQFKKRPIEAARAEATVFRVLQYCGAKPTVADDEGGPDFECSGGAYMMEATAFMNDKITCDTALQNEVPSEIRGQAFGLLTKQIAEKAEAKHRQISAPKKPGILAIASAHAGASLVLDSYAAQCLLTSEPFWRGTNENMSVDFSLSPFLRLEENGEIVAHHTGISAIVLISITADRSYVCGVLHPAPARPFDSKLLWQIPFIYSKDWPIENNRIRCAWTMGEQRTYEVPHGAIKTESYQ